MEFDYGSYKHNLFGTVRIDNNCLELQKTNKNEETVFVIWDTSDFDRAKIIEVTKKNLTRI